MPQPSFHISHFCIIRNKVSSFLAHAIPSQASINVFA
jgi:hypothetical protein